jgi:hypothetical protein
MALAIKRSDTLRVKVSPDMAERITRLSVILSLPPSTLAALAVGTWVANQERALGAAERATVRGRDGRGAEKANGAVLEGEQDSVMQIQQRPSAANTEALIFHW